MTLALMLWDDESVPLSQPDKQVILWNGYSDNPDQAVFSLFKFIEMHAFELRGRYLAWIYELGERQCRGKRIVEQLQLRSNLSFWWMTLLAEKCNFAKSPQIDDVIRLLALEKWIDGRKIDRFELVSSNANLVAVVKKWCRKNDTDFEWRKGKSKTTQPYSWQRTFFCRLPLSLQGFLWLVYKTWVSWPLRGVGVEKWRKAPAQVAFISYLDNLIPQAALMGKFESRYWANFPERLKEISVQTRWIHLWIKDDVASSASEARRLIDQFNNKNTDSQTHVALESFMGAQPIFATIKDWAKLLRFKKILKKIFLEQSRVSDFDLWPFVRGDWNKSFSGQVAVGNLLMLNLFESAFAGIPFQRVGAYLQENLGWEFGLITAWRQKGHGRLIGVPHATVRFWDLRYYFDPRNFVREGNMELPRPDCVAVNGSVSKMLFGESGYPPEQLVDVEALRYLHLLHSDNRRLKTQRNGAIRLLVIGDYVKNNTAAQMRLLEKCVASTKRPIHIIVKPHPNCSVTPEDYSGIDFVLTTDPLGKLFIDCDIAYTSNITSGAVDAYCAGIPVISFMDEKSLNLSPLRGLPHVQFITTAEELGHAISTTVGKDSEANQKVDYFNLDPSLSMWIDLLDERDKQALDCNGCAKY